MGYVEMLESADKKMIVEEKGLKITEDALLLSNFLRKYFSKKNKNSKTRKSVILEIALFCPCGNKYYATAAIHRPYSTHPK